MKKPSAPRLAIIGAGPIGLEAALAGIKAGFDVRVYERGCIAENIRDWGHVRLFSPFGMNSSEAGRRAIAEQRNDITLPGESDVISGHEYLRRYLLPLGQLPELASRIHEGTTVVGISRAHLLKGDAIGYSNRSNDPFRLLLKGVQSNYTTLADVAFDCSGVYGHHNYVGAGGLPAIGERDCLGDVDYRLPDIVGRCRLQFAGHHALVIGGGFSAATAVVALAELEREHAGTEVTWITRSGRTPPMERLENDALPERDRLAAAANKLALDSNSPIDWRPGRTVESIKRIGNAYNVRLRPTMQGGGDERLRIDRVIANVGYRPERSLYEELQVHECYATQGPMKLAAALLGESSPDCLAQTSHGVETLCNPEPGFFILGAKSYGRDSRFLINIGLQQIRDVIEFISK